MNPKDKSQWKEITDLMAKGNKYIAIGNECLEKAAKIAKKLNRPKLRLVRDETQQD